MSHSNFNRHIKFKSLLVIALVTILVSISIFATSNQVNKGRWSDDFDKNSNSWNKTGAGTKWENKTTIDNSSILPREVSQMIAKGDGLGEGLMNTIFDTRGYDEANISFRYKTTNLGAGDYFQLRQRNKTLMWQTKFNTSSNSGGWKSISKVTNNQSFLNSSDFMISFVCQGTTAGDKCWADNVTASFKLHNPALIVVDKDYNLLFATQ